MRGGPGGDCRAGNPSKTTRMASFNGSRQEGILVPLRLMSSLRLREAAQAPAKTCAQGLVEYELDSDDGAKFCGEAGIGLTMTFQVRWMSDTTVEKLVLQLLESLAGGERNDEEVMNAWRTSCLRLPVWEEACDRGLVKTVEVSGGCMVRITPAGLALLRVPQS